MIHKLRLIPLLILLLLYGYKVTIAQTNQISIKEDNLKLFFLYGDMLFCSDNQCILNAKRVTFDTLSFVGWYRKNGANHKVTGIKYILRLYINGFSKECTVINRFQITDINPKVSGILILMNVLSIDLDDGSIIIRPKLENRPILEEKYCSPMDSCGTDSYSNYLKNIFGMELSLDNQLLKGINDKTDKLTKYHQGPFVLIK